MVNHLKRISIAFSLLGFSMTLNAPYVYAMEKEDSLYTRIMKIVSKPDQPLDLEYLKKLNKEDPIDPNLLCSEALYLECRMNPMVLAICAGDEEKVKQFATSGMDPNDPAFYVWNPRLKQHYSIAHVLLDPYYLFSFEKENDVIKVSGPAYLPDFYSIDPESRLSNIDILAASGGYTYRFDTLTKVPLNDRVPLNERTIRLFSKDGHLYLQKNNGEETLLPKDLKSPYPYDYFDYPHKVRERALEIEDRQSIIDVLSNGANLQYFFEKQSPKMSSPTDVNLYWYNGSIVVSYYPRGFKQSFSLKRDWEIFSEECKTASSSLSSSDLIELLLDGPESRLGGKERKKLVRFASASRCIPCEIDFNRHLPENEWTTYRKFQHKYECPQLNMNSGIRLFRVEGSRINVCEEIQKRSNLTPLKAGLNSQGYLLEDLLPWKNMCLARAVFYGGNLRDERIAEEVLRQISEGELDSLSSQEYREQRKEDIINHLAI